MELLLFALDDRLTERAGDAGLDGVVVDLERRGKARRQADADTGISNHTLADIERVRRLTSLPVVVRLDGPDDGLDVRARRAVDAGADELLVPMVRDAGHASACLGAVPRGVPTGVLVETPGAVADAQAIGRLPLSRVFLGLVDLMIASGRPTPFDPLVDGTTERLRAALPETRFGLAGLTLPGGGHPVPVELLAAELVRCGADFTFLRRSFHRDLPSAAAMPRAVALVRGMLERAAGDPVGRGAMRAALTAVGP